MIVSTWGQQIIPEARGIKCSICGWPDETCIYYDDGTLIPTWICQSCCQSGATDSVTHR